MAQTAPLVLRLTHTGVFPSEIYIADVGDGTDGDFSKPGPLYIPPGGTIDLMFTDDVASSFRSGTINGLIERQYVTYYFVQNEEIFGVTRAELYVDPDNGTSDGDGSEEFPVNTINAALALLPSDLNRVDRTIYLAAGTYEESLFLSRFFNGKIFFIGTYEVVETFQLTGFTERTFVNAGAGWTPNAFAKMIAVDKDSFEYPTSTYNSAAIKGNTADTLDIAYQSYGAAVGHTIEIWDVSKTKLILSPDPGSENNTFPLQVRDGLQVEFHTCLFEVPSGAPSFYPLVGSNYLSNYYGYAYRFARFRFEGFSVSSSRYIVYTIGGGNVNLDACYAGPAKYTCGPNSGLVLWRGVYLEDFYGLFARPHISVQLSRSWIEHVERCWFHGDALNSVIDLEYILMSSNNPSRDMMEIDAAGVRVQGPGEFHVSGAGKAAISFKDASSLTVNDTFKGSGDYAVTLRGSHNLVYLPYYSFTHNVASVKLDIAGVTKSYPADIPFADIAAFNLLRK